MGNGTKCYICEKHTAEYLMTEVASEIWHRNVCPKCLNKKWGPIMEISKCPICGKIRFLNFISRVGNEEDVFCGICDICASVHILSYDSSGTSEVYKVTKLP